MSDKSQFQLYEGDGSHKDGRDVRLPDYDQQSLLTDPAGYIAEPGLRDAVNVALALGQPLLVTGEPGTGKTLLGASIARNLGLGEPLVFNTKTTSTARDLFYRYDALRHFHAAQFREQAPAIQDYIEFEALGRAILLGMDPSETQDLLTPSPHDKGPVRSVVVVDEIDKAPRDLPNDVLAEIEQMSFTVRETGQSFSADRTYRPIVVLTSNSEKTLPDAFLRRCVFYHISFPNRDRLEEIVRRRLGHLTLAPDKLRNAIEHFERLRELGLRKKPATAELLAWLSILDRFDLDVANPKPGEPEVIAFTYSILAKGKDDLSLLQDQAWEKPKN